MRRELEVLAKSVALINKSQSQRLAEEWVRKKQATKLLDISPRCLCKLTKSGKLPSSKINGLIYIKTSDIEQMLKEGRVNPSSTDNNSTFKTKSNV